MKNTKGVLIVCINISGWTSIKIGIRTKLIPILKDSTAVFKKFDPAILQAATNGTNWATLPAYTNKPNVEEIKGWVCDDGLFYNPAVCDYKFANLKIASIDKR